jgi:hypothetical protein
MLRRLCEGGVAGALATLLMSAVVWGCRRLGIYHQKPPPETISERLLGRIGIRHAVPKRWRRVLTAMQHTGFGAGGGALYGLLARIVPPGAPTGTLFGLLIWLVSYKGWVPAAGLMPPPEGDERGRQVTMVAAHVVYGASLGVAVQQRERRHEDEW